MTTTPAPRFTEIDRANALGVYLDCHGDVTATSRALGGSPRPDTLARWAEKFQWDVYLEKIRERLVEDTVDEVLQRKQQDLSMLRMAKVKLAQAIQGKKNEHDQIIEEPLKARSLESATTALARAIEVEQNMLRGPGGGEDQTQNFFLTLVKQAVGDADAEIKRREHEKEVPKNRLRSPAGGNSEPSSDNGEGGSD